MADLFDPVFIRLPESTRPSLNSSPRETLRLPHVPAHPPPGVAPLPRFRSERLLPAPNITCPIPPTFGSGNLTPQCAALQDSSSSFETQSSKKRFAADRFIPSNHSIISFKISTPLPQLSPEEKLLRRSTGNDIFGRGRSSSPPPLSSSRYRSSGTEVSRITTAGRAIYIGAGSSRGTEVSINVFGDQDTPELEQERHETQLAAALGIDLCTRVLCFTREPIGRTAIATVDTWSRATENYSMSPKKKAASSQALIKNGTIPTTPFRVLDAPGLRDDYYCSLLAYSGVTHSLAVGLHSDVYTWTESTGASPFNQWSTSHVTCLAFSSSASKKNILAIGRIDGNLCLWKPGESKPRIERVHTAGVACLSWRPTVQKRWDASFAAVTSTDREMLPRQSNSWVDCEDLLVGDEMGVVYYYTVFWSTTPNTNDRRFEAGGARFKLLKKIMAHTQQICGLAWSGDGTQFATGGNDNVACLFNVEDIFAPSLPDESKKSRLRRERGKYRWSHGAAVKAMAFCPWQRSLLATGGGSNDRCIHFFHTYSGACLATIHVSAQVTSLLWSNSHREIAATFGYANPDHPIRIAVYSWPECKQVAAIPWGEDMRALYAVGYPGGPIEDPTEDISENIEDDVSEDNFEMYWPEIERSMLSRGTLSIRGRVVELPTHNSGETGVTNDVDFPRGRTVAINPAINNAIPATAPFRTNTNSRSRSRGRAAPEVEAAEGTRNSSIVQAASLMRRRTRSGRGTAAPGTDGRKGPSRHAEGCIVVAASDETVRFHEVWSDRRKGILGFRGVLGGSDILEGLEGIEKDGREIIR